MPPSTPSRPRGSAVFSDGLDKVTLDGRTSGGCDAGPFGAFEAMATLDRAEAERRVKELNGWTLDGNAIRKQFVLRDFPAAVAFVQALVPGAEAADHHPDILINYKRVTLTYSTHSEGGLTEKDFAGAGMADDVFSQR